MFIDEVKINIEAGKGGDGAASFRREKYIPKGGPDGGDGGKGGDIIIKVDNNLDTLSHFNSKKFYKAEDGERGKHRRMHGKNGQDIVLSVLPGTVIYEIINGSKEKIVDLLNEKQKYIIAKGGQGGLGNDHFKSATHQAPREFTPGEPGEKKELIFELKLIADVGLVGLPNAGKSTLINAISNSKAQIASYPFTTVIPNLGVVNYKQNRFIVADIPGLIEGASTGKGLGHKFLRHIARTKIIIHLIDINDENVIDNYTKINKELEKYEDNLITKKQLIVFNKIDTLTDKQLLKKQKSFNNFFKDKKSLYISAAGRINLDQLQDAILETINT